MRYRFADCELCSETRVLVRAGARVPVQPKVLDLLLVLLRHPGQLLSEAVLEGRLWPGVRVSSASLRRLVKEARRAIGDDGRRQRVLRTVRGRGYRLVATVATDAWDDAIFVGRTALLAALEASLEGAAEGAGRAVLLEGEAGVGKTHVALAMGSRARALGLVVVHVGCGATPAPACHGPWREAIRALIGLRPALAARAPARWSALRELTAAEPVPPSAAEAAQMRLLEDLHEFLAEASRSAPLAIILDDLHAADPESLHAFAFLVPRLAGLPIWLLGCHRSEALLVPDPHRRALAGLAGGPGPVETWTLAGLSRSEVEELLEARTGEPGWSDLAELLVRRTGGNPFWIDALLRDLASRDRLCRPLPLDGLDAEIPDRLQPVLRRRLACLPPDGEALLGIAAAVGNVFDAALLAALAERNPADVEAALEQAAAAHLVTREPVTPGRWRFAHELVREGLEALAAERPGERARLHLRIAEALERSGAAPAAALAHHAARAVSLLGPAAVSARHEAAGREAAASHAFQEAAAHYEAALALIPAAGGEDECRRGRLLLALADACLASEGLDAARHEYARAAAAARRGGDAETLARAALGFAFRRSGTGSPDPQVVALLEEALAALDSRCPALAIRLRGRLGTELLSTSRARGEVLLAAALAEARSLGDPLVLGWVLEGHGIWSAEDPDGYLAVSREIERIGRTAGDTDLAFRGVRARATAMLEHGDRAGLDAAIEGCERLVRQWPLRHSRAVVAGMHGMRALLEGRIEEALRHVKVSAELGAGSGALGLDAQVGAQLFAIHREEGTLDRIEPRLAELRARHGGLWGLRLLSALAAAEGGRLGPARAELAAFASIAPDRLPRDRNWLPTHVVAAELAALVGDRESAGLLAERLAPYAELNAVVGACGLFLGSVAHALGLVDLARGDGAAAQRHFALAREMHARLRAPRWLARSEAGMARAAGGVDANQRLSRR